MSGKTATPATAATESVPESVPPEGFAPSATVTVPVKLERVFPEASWAATVTVGAMGRPATLAPGCVVTTRRAGARATRRSAALSALPPYETHPLVRPVPSTPRACQWYATLSSSPPTVAVAVVPRGTGGLDADATFVNAVPTGRTSTSRRTWSPTSESATTPVIWTVDPSVVPPVGMTVTPSALSCTSAVGADGGWGMATEKSAVPGPNSIQPLERPVRSTARTCQWYDVPLARPPATTAARLPDAAHGPDVTGVPENAVPTGRTSTSRRTESSSGSATRAVMPMLSPLTVPPTGTGVARSLVACARLSGAAGGAGRVAERVNAPVAPAAAPVTSTTKSPATPSRAYRTQASVRPGRHASFSA